MRLYHGTNAKEEILSGGFAGEFVYLLADKNRAADYGDDVVSVYVSDADLLVDLDLPNAVGVDADTANQMTGLEYSSAAEYAAAGYAVCARVNNCQVLA